MWGILIVIIGLALAVPSASAQVFRVCGWEALDAVAAFDLPTIQTAANAPGVVHLTRQIGKKRDYCGAAIVAPGWALTARHCVDGKRWSFLAAQADGAIWDADLALCPSASLRGTLRSDVALIRFTPADIGPNPVRRMDGSGNFPSDLWLASWSTRQANRGGGPVRIRHLDTSERRGDQIALTLAEGEDRPPCGGESGSPLYAASPEGPVLVATLSALLPPRAVVEAGIHRCASPLTQVLVTPVATWSDWIDDAIAECASAPELCVRPE